jgi:predicted AAA+ superfamily ATPase
LGIFLQVVRSSCLTKTRVSCVCHGLCRTERWGFVNEQNIESFQHFVRLRGALSGLLLNVQNLPKDCGITYNTVKVRLAKLEVNYMISLLRPHHVNYNKRLINSLKLYFYVRVLPCWLLGLQTLE